MNAKDKLIAALDVDTADEALRLFESLRDSVGMFKIGMQLFTAAGPDVVRRIISRDGKIFLDLKYHDIPNTVAMAAVEAARLGVTLFNIHVSGGHDMMKRAAEAVADVTHRERLPKPKILGVTVLTSIDQLTLQQIGIEDDPAKVVGRLASLAASAGLDGVVASAQEIRVVRESVAQENFLVVTPGIRATPSNVQDQRRTMPATEAVRAGADYLVVGRPILAAPDPVRAAQDLADEIHRAMSTRLEEQTRAQSVQ